MLQDMIDLRKVAESIQQGLDFVQRRTTDPKHPDYIPNVQIGRKRFVKITDLQAWVDRHTNRQPLTTA